MREWRCGSIICFWTLPTNSIILRNGTNIIYKINEFILSFGSTLLRRLEPLIFAMCKIERESHRCAILNQLITQSPPTKATDNQSLPKLDD